MVHAAYVEREVPASVGYEDAKLGMPVENLLTPDFLRRIAWRPPAEITLESIGAALAELGARRWQIENVAAIITVAFLDPEPLPEKGQAARQPASSSAGGGDEEQDPQ